MKKIIILLILSIFFLSSCSLTSNTIKEPLILEGPYTVTKVIDGDTLDINTSQRIRLSGINTPEIGECYYQEAKDKLTQLTLEKQVYLEKDKTDKGKYGRLLRYIYINNTLINELLVLEGYAKVYDKYAYDTKRYSQLKKAEEQAKSKKLGVWSCQDKKQNCLYVGSKKSDKYYPPECKWAKRIKPENLICFKSEKEVQNRTPGKGC
jgi:micrococcal nuclease